MAHIDFKHLTRRTVSAKILHDKAFSIAKNPKYDGYQRGLASMPCKTNLLVVQIKMNKILNVDLAEELHKPIIRHFNKRNVHSPFIDNSWGADLVASHKQIFEGIRFLLSVIDIFSKCAWVFPLKDKKCIPITNAFQKAFKESGHKPDKIWVDKGSEFYNRLMKSILQNNNIEMYSTHNEGKSVVAERFIRLQYMTSISKMHILIN